MGYTQKRKTMCGDSFTAMDRNTPFLLQKGVWYHLILSVTMNSPPDARNGRAELFINGQSTVVANELQWRAVNGATIEHFKLSTFYGGSSKSWAPTRTTHIQYDNFVIRTTGADVDPWCATGIRTGNVCCASSCGTCRGPGCGAKDGGASQCCAGAIKKGNEICTDFKQTGC